MGSCPQQIQEALQRAHLDLEETDQQIGDLKIQATIMNSGEVRAPHSI